MKDLRLTLIQTSLHWENSTANLALLDALMNKIKSGSTDLILLPEMFTSGFTMQAASNAQTMDGPAVRWMQKTAKAKKAVICGSLIITEKKNYYNRLIWMEPSGHYLHYDKRHLFSMAREEKTYTAGKSRLVTEWKGWKICPLICYDLRFPVWSRRTVRENYDLLIYVANWPARRQQAWKQLLVARAIENQCYVAGLNRVGKDGNGIPHTGHSAVLDPFGNKISKTAASRPSIETITLKAKDIQDWRRQLNTLQDSDSFKIL